jgi:hypothetical protein
VVTILAVLLAAGCVSTPEKGKSNQSVPVNESHVVSKPEVSIKPEITTTTTISIPEESKNHPRIFNTNYYGNMQLDIPEQADLGEAA